ncbi:hypothetical protein CS063_03930 [Sporanaerobium hydrogeniformans]|uniref:Uncharacterized protein n=1 Tax=Sporanaerobium hydrogeniformans TaxID=3072179 RepID=A0AC61DF76_9FIRM|nr:hypothetical protein [Sporanaerobium hydrogeniformans]PHV71718.1 hypothetical protein CS063_03930 [Sporanaerobium hydrogeniformans]
MQFLKNFLRSRKAKSSVVVDMPIRTIEQLFEELGELFVKKKRIEEYIGDLERREQEIKKFDALKKEDRERLSLLASRAKDLEEKKQSLKGRLIKNNKSLFIVSQYEAQIPELIHEIQQCEKKKRESERNMYYLEEEREELLEEREALLKGYHFLKIFSIVFIVTIGIGLLMTFGYMQALREKTWVYLSGFGSILVLFVGGLIYAKEHIEKELNKNAILQQKAARYMNKTKIRYFHQVRYLNFQYDKLGVDSAAKLEMYYSRYLKNKDNEKKYTGFNRTLSEIEEEMLAIIKSKGIAITYIENLSDWLLTNKKVSSLKTLEADKEKTLEQLQIIEGYEEDLWKEIFALQEEPEARDFINNKLKEYNRRISMPLDKLVKDA